MDTRVQASLCPLLPRCGGLSRAPVPAGGRAGASRAPETTRTGVLGRWRDSVDAKLARVKLLAKVLPVADKPVGKQEGRQAIKQAGKQAGRQVPR